VPVAAVVPDGPKTGPSPDRTGVDAEQVQGAPDGVVNEIVDGAGTGVEGGHGRGHDRAVAGDLGHEPQVRGPQWRLAHQQDQPPAFLECDVGGADEKGVVVAVGDA